MGGELVGSPSRASGRAGVWIEAAVASAVAILIIVTYVRKKVVSPPLEKEAHIVAIEKDMKNCC